MSITYVALRWIFAVAVIAWAAAASAAESTHEYEYDELGRLKKVISPETDVSYGLDPAGNRTNVTGSAGHGLPGPVVVPPTSLTGDYPINWGASTTPPAARYELYEASNPEFFGEVERYDGTGLSFAFNAKPDGTYYYRVRACTVTGCGPRRPGPHPVVVARPPAPSQPGAMSMPPAQDIDGTYTISWGASTGMFPTDGVPPDGVYELYEAFVGGPFGTTPIYTGATPSATISGKGNGMYAYRVRACNPPSCSVYRDAPSTVWVTLPPSVPGGAVLPSAYNNTGSYTVTWAASTGQVTAYELLEYRAFGNESVIYTGENTSLPVSGRADGVYTYRLRACNTPLACSAYTATAGNGGAVYVDRIAPTPPTTLSRISPDYTIIWSGGSTDTAGSGAGSGVGSWNVYRNGAYIATSTGQSFRDTSPPANVTLSYTVRSVDRAGNESGPSPAYQLYVDTIPPTTPGNFRATSVTSGSVALAWDASSDAFGISWYRIARSGSGTVMGNGDASTTYVDSTVSSGVTYTYQVFAVDGHGVESAPASVTVTTLAGAPGTPSINGCCYRRDTDGIFTISWSTSPGASYYVLEQNGAGGTVTGTSVSYNTGGNGWFEFRVKACTAGGLCSGFSSTKVVDVCISGTSCL